MSRIIVDISKLTLKRLASCRIWTSRQGHCVLNELATSFGSMGGPVRFVSDLVD